MKKIVIVILTIFILCGCKQTESDFKVNREAINVVVDDNPSTFDFDLHSRGYMLVRLNDLNVLYKKNAKERIYPASLTKIATLDAVLSLCDNLKDTSSITSNQLATLVSEDASLANLKANKEYTIEELLYALILPSGADAAVALENYFLAKGINLVNEMNIKAKELGCLNTHYVNTTGLHNDDHYTSLEDLLLIVLDVLQYECGRKVLETLNYLSSDDFFYHSTVTYVSGYNVDVLGGKTGFTTVAGQLIVVIYRKDNRSYLLMLSNSDGDSYNEIYYHYEDCIEIFRRLYD